MPIYEYRCGSCQRRVSIFFRGFSAVADPVCPRCGSRELTRLVSRVAFHRSASPAGDDFDGALDDFDESDPRAMARSLRAMSDEMGEPLEPEMEEALGRLEAGEDPDAVMGELEDASAAGDSAEFDEF